MEQPTSIHEFDFNLICSYFKSLERQGPGSPEVTRLAAGFIEGLSETSRIADLGCGTGGQTLELARCVPGHITGLDLFPGFIDVLNRKAAQADLAHRVKGIVGAMENLPFQPEELDLIWSEGAISHIGFREGLQRWKRFLQPGGHIAVSEATWFKPEPPTELQAYWMENYPPIDTIPVKIAQMEAAGYQPVAHFVLPQSCWIEHYYQPQAPLQERFLQEHAGNKAARDFIAMQRYDSSLYDRYGDYYGYAFYIGRKR